MSRLVKRLPELHVRYKAFICTGEKADARTESTFSKIQERESWAASVLQKIMRGHLDRCYVRALSWLNDPENLSKLYVYFDVNRDGNLSRGEIGNMVYQLLSQRFDPYKSHSNMLEGTFDVDRLIKWWNTAKWGITTIVQKVRFVNVIRNLVKFSHATEHAAASLKRIAKVK